MNSPGHHKQDLKKNKATEELKTDGPISEKDEVKEAELRTAKLHKKASARTSKDK